MANPEVEQQQSSSINSSKFGNTNVNANDDVATNNDYAEEEEKENDAYIRHESNNSIKAPLLSDPESPATINRASDATDAKSNRKISIQLLDISPPDGQPKMTSNRTSFASISMLNSKQFSPVSRQVRSLTRFRFLVTADY